MRAVHMNRILIQVVNLVKRSTRGAFVSVGHGVAVQRCARYAPLSTPHRVVRVRPDRAMIVVRGNAIAKSPMWKDGM